MVGEQSTEQTARDALERVLSSVCFARSERVSKLLRFLVEKQLGGNEGDLKESIIGVEVFGRRPDYDPKQDSTVRTEAVRLRARLSKYYATEGDRDSLVIELPKGAYVPRFHAREADFAVKDKATGASRVWLVVLLVCLSVGSAMAIWWNAKPHADPISIAVLPLVNLSQDPASDYFSDGLSIEIIRNLSIIDGLAVRSQTSSFAFKGKQANVHEAGKKLSAEYILEGSVLRSGERLRINVQLIRVNNDLPLWSERYDRELTDVFSIQDEISFGIVNSLRLKLGRGRRRYETSVGAYDAYLRARALQNGKVFASEESIAPFKEAIAKDRAFAPAYAGLAVAYADRSSQNDRDQALSDDLPNMRAAAEKAIQLDPLLSEAHEGLGMSYARDGQWEEAERSFRRAIELDSTSSTARGHYVCNLLMPLGRIEEGIRELRLAQKYDPLSVEISFRLAIILISAGRYEEAEKHCEMQVPGSELQKVCHGRVRIGQGRIGEAIQVLSGIDYDRGLLGYAYALAGRREEAWKVLADRTLHPGGRALVFIGLGETDRAFEALDDLAAHNNTGKIGGNLRFPEFAPLLSDPRMKALRKKIRLPD